MQPFADRLTDAVRRCGTPACVGLDPDPVRLPRALLPQGVGRPRAELAQAAETFCMGVIEVVEGLVPAVKPQVAYFEALGAPGVAALERVVARAQASGLLVILDAKRGDIGSTAKAYVRATLDDAGPIGADAVTLSPYLGTESLDPFVRATQAGKGIFLLVRTSNPGAGAWQNGGENAIAERVAGWIAGCNAARLGRSGFGPAGAVIGATLSGEAPRWRESMPHAWFLVPGYGAQGASAADCRPHRAEAGLGALVVSARGVLYPANEADPSLDWRTGVRERASAFSLDLSQGLC